MASYVKELNKEIKKIKHQYSALAEPKHVFKGRLKYNNISKKIAAVLNNDFEEITFHSNLLLTMVGLPDDMNTIKYKEEEYRPTKEYYYEFPKTCSFNLRGSHIFVYSNLVKESIIGGVFTPVMRLVGLKDKPKNETVHREYALPH